MFPSPSSPIMKNSGSGPTLYSYPCFATLSRAFLSTNRGSPSNGVPSGQNMSHINLQTPFSSGLQGRVENVFGSGFIIKSLALMSTNPSIDEPSNSNPSLSISSMSPGLASGTAIFFGVPCMSTNCNLTNFVPHLSMS